MTVSLPAHSLILERQISQFVLIAPTTHLSVQEQAGAAGGAVYWFKFRKPKTKTSGNSDLDDYDFGEDDEETVLDDADLMAETESEDDE